MPCRVIAPGVIACSRGESRRSCRCGRNATKLCDFPLRGTKSGRTCDRPMCDKCARQQGRGVDYCEPHDRLAKTPIEDPNA